MRAHRLALLAGPLACVSRAAQVPFAATHTILEVDAWRFDQPPSPNETANFIFDTVASALQHWHHTRYRNGHAIIPGYVPTGTLLYHGASGNTIPDGPEWTATDPEHSYMFCRDQADAGCWHLTLAAARPLKVLYFDGSSAAKMRDGPMHTQDVVAWGNVMPDRFFDERNRIKDLCAWGDKYGVDGFVRMEMDFEIMLCNFTNGVEVVSWSNLRANGRHGPGPGRREPGKLYDAPGRDYPHKRLNENKDDDDPAGRPPPGRPIKVPNGSQWAEVLLSGSWHNRYPGDARIVLHAHRLLTFYDTSLAPSLVPVRARAETRFEHSLLGIDAVDARTVLRRLEAYYASQIGRDADADQPASGVDWQTLARVIVDRHADRLELARYLFNESLLVLDDLDSSPVSSASSPSKALVLAERALTQIYGIVFPYALHSARPPEDPVASKKTDGESAEGANGPHAWVIPVWQECADAHTRSITRRHPGGEHLSASERTLLRAVRETKREICRVAVGIWADAEERTFGTASGAAFGDGESDDTEGIDVRALRAAVSEWRDAVVGLMDWLDWSVWVQCRPACGYEEFCYLPTWPFIGGGARRRRKPDDDDVSLSEYDRRSTQALLSLSLDLDTREVEHECPKDGPLASRRARPGSPPDDSPVEQTGESDRATRSVPPPRRRFALPDDESYKRPQPMCMRRVEDY